MTPTQGHRPGIAVAMAPGVARRFLTPSDWQFMAGVGRVLHPEPLTEFVSPHARGVLEHVEVLVTGWGAPRLDLQALTTAPRLRAVVHTGGTVRDVVTDDLWGRSIAVSTAADANATPVAEYTVAMVLLAGKRVVEVAREFRERRARTGWVERFPDVGNYRRTVGLLSASRVGRKVAELLRPHDLDVLVHDPTVPDGAIRRLGAEPVELEDLFRRSHVLSIHAPLLPETQGLVDARLLGLMRDGSTIVNTARGRVVETAALEAEVLRGRLSAILDVTDPEPLETTSPLWDSDNVLLTPHVAGSAGGELRRLTESAMAELHLWCTERRFTHPVDTSGRALFA